MFCSFCKKGASKLVTHSLCGCCLVHLGNTKNTPDEDASGKVDCEICLEKYREDELEEHREMCSARLVFRCAVCDGDYMSKEGLWNHLDLHEIADSSKESYYRETRATYKLHKCGLCNDQRGYQESLYWRHVREDHDGFFLQCSECGDNFRSEKSKNDHTLSLCKPTAEQTLPMVDQKSSSIDHPIKIETPTLDAYGDWNQCGKAVEGIDSSVTEENSINAVEHIPTPIGGNSSSGSSETKCSYCDKIFRDTLLLTGHVENCHLPNVCNICGETVFGRTRFRYHKLKNHTEAKHKCPYCPMEFHRNNNFQRHMSRHVEERNFPCELCGAKFKSLQYVALHKRRNHQVKKQQSDSPDCNEKNSVDESSQHSDDVASDEESSSTIHHCPVCDVKFDDEELFSQHVGEVHQLTVCTICGTTLASVDQLEEHKETHHTKAKYSCSQCNQTFERKTAFQDHLAEHAKKAKFQCGLCDLRFVDQATLQIHMVSVHNTAMNPDGIQCTCPICGETIPSILMFRHHKLKFHTEPKYQCPHCPRKFLTKGNYTSHVVAHKRKRIFSCRFCSVRYKRLHMLQAHMERRHGSDLKDADQSGQIFTINNQDMVLQDVEPEDLDHGNSMSAYGEGNGEEDVEIKEEILVEEAPMAPSSLNSTECSQCHQLYSDANALQDHLRVSHQSIKCETCELDFENQVRLRYHKLVSHTVPRYECSQCAKKFHVRTSLVRHEWTHRKEDGAENSLKPVIRTRIRTKFAAPKTRETDQSTDFECNLCSSKFLNEERLHRHIDYTHSKAEVQCTICNLSFPSQYKMYYHKTKVHTEPQHKCPHCEKKFHVKYRLKEHLVVHLTLGDERNPNGSRGSAKVKEEM